MKTYAIFPVRNTTFCVDGVSKEFTPEDQIGVVSVDGVSLMDLLGALQFHHCKAVELDEAEMLRFADGDGGEIEVLVEEIDGERIGTVVSGECQPGEGTLLGGFESEGDTNLETIDLDESTTTLDDTTEFEKPGQSSQSNQATSSQPFDQFIADGLDEKIATVLAAQGCTPESIRGLISEGFDLTELEEIGKSRAASILAVYGPKPTE